MCVRVRALELTVYVSFVAIHGFRNRLQIFESISLKERETTVPSLYNVDPNASMYTSS